MQRDVITITDGVGSYRLRPRFAPAVTVYRLVTPGYWPHHISGPDMANQMFENYFFLVRVLPYDDYSEIDDDDLTFELIYDQIFRYYALIFPAMNKRLPLNDPAVWRSPTTAQYVLKMTDVALWNYFHYMPRTRDLSKYQRDLLRRFCHKVLNVREAASNPEVSAHAAD